MNLQLVQVFRILNGIDSVEKKHFFELDNGGGYSLRGHRMKIESSERSFAAETRFLQSQDCQDMEHVASISRGGFNRPDI